VAVVPALGSPTGACTQESQCIDALDVQHLAQALVDKKVLTPHARSTTEFTEVVSAFAPARGKGLYSSARQNFKRSLKAKPAIIEVDSAWNTCITTGGQRSSKPLRKEDTIRVYLCSPIMPKESAVFGNLVPHRTEGINVEWCIEFATSLAMQVRGNSLN